MVKIVRYSSDMQAEWDAFIRESKNGTFLFERPYMDYHSDRFADFSLMFYDEKNRLVAVLPANERGDVVYSHQGLTYGGFILTDKTHTLDMIEIYDVTIDYLREQGFKRFIYKQMPAVYHTVPSQEDEYVLWRVGAKTVCCGMSTSVLLTDSREKYRKMVRSRKLTDYNKLQRAGYKVRYDVPLSEFWPILCDNLMARHNLLPVHTLEEIELLKSRFPQQIVCCVVENSEGKIEAGTVLYVTRQVVHSQYISSSPTGKHTHSLDFLFLSLIDRFREEGRHLYFDFGISTERDGEYLNEGLISQKESYGGRAITYKTYEIILAP